MTQRVGFVLQVRPERIDDYVRAHAEVWPEMLAALEAAGIRNYTIFRYGTQVFGYFEADDLAESEAFLGRQEVCARWQDEMAGFLQERVRDQGPRPLEQIFRLD